MGLNISIVNVVYNILVNPTISNLYFWGGHRIVGDLPMKHGDLPHGYVIEISKGYLCRKANHSWGILSELQDFFHQQCDIWVRLKVDIMGITSVILRGNNGKVMAYVTNNNISIGFA